MTKRLVVQIQIVIPIIATIESAASLINAASPMLTLGLMIALMTEGLWNIGRRIIIMISYAGPET